MLMFLDKAKLDKCLITGNRDWLGEKVLKYHLMKCKNKGHQ
jgi:hypothetical protein